MGRDDDDDPGHNQDQYKLNGKIMLTAILSLTFVIVLVVLLHIYARCALRRQARRRAALYRLTIADTAAQVQSREPPKTGLDPSVIAALPIFIYKHNGQLDDAAAVAECAVCLSTIEEEEMVRLLPNCNHTFHAQCIDMWLSSHSTCPICRAEAEPQPPPNPHEAAIEVLPTAPPLNSMTPCSEDASDGAAQCSKVGGSSSRLSSFRRMLSRERSERRIQPLGQTDGVGDLERQ